MTIERYYIYLNNLCPCPDQHKGSRDCREVDRIKAVILQMTAGELLDFRPGQQVIDFSIGRLAALDAS